ncbi:uncharacterized protein LOC128883576 [Hylaeus volcanicus]|uniref:uncharacterized protein LOC128883576 n=1 Tax=Hylaeus volcanicus TaxID=313075 RepID=UPI0023B85271|nr:uncharacterized protein LOC128883576 [Hylaeus volcanicus]
MSELSNLVMNSFSSFGLSKALEVQELCVRIHYLCKRKKAYAVQHPNSLINIKKYITFLVKICLKFLKAAKTGQPPKFLLDLEKTKKTIKECLSSEGLVYLYISQTLKDHLKLLLVELSRVKLDYPLNLCFKKSKKSGVKKKRKILKANVAEIIKIPLNDITTMLHPLPEFPSKNQFLKRLKRRNNRQRFLFLKYLPFQYCKDINGLCYSIASDVAEPYTPGNAKVSHFDKRLPKWFRDTYEKNYANLKKNCEEQIETLLHRYQRRLTAGKINKLLSGEKYSYCYPYVASIISKSDQDDSVNEISIQHVQDFNRGSKKQTLANDYGIDDFQMHNEEGEGKIHQNIGDKTQNDLMSQRRSSSGSVNLKTDADSKSQTPLYSTKESCSLVTQKRPPKSNVGNSLKSLLLKFNIVNWSRNRLAGSESFAEHISSMKRKAAAITLPKLAKQDYDHKDISNHLVENYEKKNNSKDFKHSYSMFNNKNKVVSNSSKNSPGSPSFFFKRPNTLQPGIELKKGRKKSLILLPLNKNESLNSKNRLNTKKSIHIRSDQLNTTFHRQSEKFNWSTNLSNKPPKVSLSTKDNQEQCTNQSKMNDQNKTSDVTSQRLYRPLNYPYWDKDSHNTTNVEIAQDSLNHNIGMSPSLTNGKSSNQSQKKSVINNKNGRLPITSALFPIVFNTTFGIRNLLKKLISNKSQLKDKHLTHHHNEMLKAPYFSSLKDPESLKNSEKKTVNNKTEQQNMLEKGVVGHETFHSKVEDSRNALRIRVNGEKQVQNHFQEITKEKKEFSRVPEYSITSMNRYKEAGLIPVEVVSKLHFEFHPMYVEKRVTPNSNRNLNRAMVSQSAKQRALKDNIGDIMESVPNDLKIQESKNKQSNDVNNTEFKLVDRRMSYEVMKDSFIFIMYPKSGFFMENYKRQSKPFFSNVDNILSSKEKERSVNYNVCIQPIEELSPVHGSNQLCAEQSKTVHHRFKRKKLRTIQNNTDKKNSTPLVAKNNHKLASQHTRQTSEQETKDYDGFPVYQDPEKMIIPDTNHENARKSYEAQHLSKLIEHKGSSHEESKSLTNVDWLMSTPLKNQVKNDKQSTRILLKRKIRGNAQKYEGRVEKNSEPFVTRKEFFKKVAAKPFNKKKTIKATSLTHINSTSPDPDPNNLIKSSKIKKTRKKRKIDVKSSALKKLNFDPNMVSHDHPVENTFKKIPPNTLFNEEMLESLDKNKTVLKHKGLLKKNNKTKTLFNENLKNKRKSYSNARHQVYKSPVMYQKRGVNENEAGTLIKSTSSISLTSQSAVEMVGKVNVGKEVLNRKNVRGTYRSNIRQKHTSNKKKLERKQSKSDALVNSLSKLDVSKTKKVKHNNKVTALVLHQDKRNTSRKTDIGPPHPNTKEKALYVSTISSSLLPIETKFKLKATNIKQDKNTKVSGLQVRGTIDFREIPRGENMLKAKQHQFTTAAEQRSSSKFWDDASCFDMGKTNIFCTVEDTQKCGSSDYSGINSTDAVDENPSSTDIRKKVTNIKNQDSKFYLKTLRNHRVDDLKQAQSSGLNLTETKNKNNVSQNFEPVLLLPEDKGTNESNGSFKLKFHEPLSSKVMDMSRNYNNTNDMACTAYDYKKKKVIPVEYEQDESPCLHLTKRHTQELQTNSILSQVNIKKRHLSAPFVKDFGYLNLVCTKNVTHHFTKSPGQTIVYGCLQDPSYIQTVEWSTGTKGQLADISDEKVSQGCEKQTFSEPQTKIKNIALKKDLNDAFKMKDDSKENVFSESSSRTFHFNQKTANFKTPHYHLNKSICRSHSTFCVSVNSSIKNLIQEGQSNTTRTVNMKKRKENKEFNESQRTSEVESRKTEMLKHFLKKNCALSRSTSSSSTLNRTPFDKSVCLKTYNFEAQQLKTSDTKKVGKTKNAYTKRVTAWKSLRSTFNHHIKTFSTNSLQKSAAGQSNEKAEGKWDSKKLNRNLKTACSINLIGTDLSQVDNRYSLRKFELQAERPWNNKKTQNSDHSIVKKVGLETLMYHKRPVSDTSLCKPSESLGSKQTNYLRGGSYDNISSISPHISNNFEFITNSQAPSKGLLKEKDETLITRNIKELDAPKHCDLISAKTSDCRLFSVPQRKLIAGTFEFKETNDNECSSFEIKNAGNHLNNQKLNFKERNKSAAVDENLQSIMKKNLRNSVDIAERNYLKQICESETDQSKDISNLASENLKTNSLPILYKSEECSKTDNLTPNVDAQKEHLRLKLLFLKRKKKNGIEKSATVPFKKISSMETIKSRKSLELRGLDSKLTRSLNSFFRNTLYSVNSDTEKMKKKNPYVDTITLSPDTKSAVGNKETTYSPNQKFYVSLAPDPIEGIQLPELVKSPDVKDKKAQQQLGKHIDSADVEQRPDTVNITEVERLLQVVDVTGVERRADVVDVTEVDQSPERIDVKKEKKWPEVVDVTAVERLGDVVYVTEIEQSPEGTDVTEIEQWPVGTHVTEREQSIEITDVTDIEQLQEGTHVTAIEQSLEGTGVTDVEQLPVIVDVTGVDQSPERMDVKKEKKWPEVVDVTAVERLGDVVYVTEIEQSPEGTDVTEIEQSTNVTEIEQSPERTNVTEIEQSPERTDAADIEKSPKGTHVTEREQLPEGTHVTQIEQSPKGSDVTQIEQSPERTDVTEIEQSPERTNVTEIEQSPERTNVTEIEQSPERTDATEIEQLPEGTHVTQIEQSPKGSDVTEIEQSPERTDVTEIEQSPERTDATDIEQSPKGTHVTEREQLPEGTHVTDIEQSPKGTHVTQIEQSPERTDVTEIEQSPERIDATDIEKSPKGTHVTEREQLPEGTHVTDIEQSPKGTHVTEREQLLEGTHITDIEQSPKGTHVTEREQLKEGTYVTYTEQSPKGTHVSEREQSPERTDVTHIEQSLKGTHVTDIEQSLERTGVTDIEQFPEGTHVKEMKKLPPVLDVKEVDRLPAIVDVTGVDQSPERINVKKEKKLSELVDVTAVKPLVDVVSFTEMEQSPNETNVTEVEKLKPLLDATGVAQSPEKIDGKEKTNFQKSST